MKIRWEIWSSGASEHSRWTMWLLYLDSYTGNWKVCLEHTLHLSISINQAYFIHHFKNPHLQSHISSVSLNHRNKHTQALVFCSHMFLIIGRTNLSVCLDVLHTHRYCSILLEWLCRHSGLAPTMYYTGPISTAWLNTLRLISPWSISYTCRC